VQERWVPIADYVGLYEVSDLGRVRSLDRAVEVVMPFGRTVRHYRGRVLRQIVNKGTRGYATVGLCKDGQHTTRLVHQLVAEAFLPPRQPGQEVRHGPNGKLDNRASQLCYGTRAENVRDRTRDGQDNRGERYGAVKLTAAGVVDIKARVAAGEMQTVLAKEYRVTRGCIWAVVHNVSWSYAD
jgi:hypothetical protein